MSFVVHAYTFPTEGERLDIKDTVISGQRTFDFDHWIHLDGANTETANWLRSVESGVPSLIVEALLAQETRPRLTRFDEGFLINLRGVNLNENAEPEDMVSIRLWVESNRIISVRFRKLRAVTDIADQIKMGAGPKNLGTMISHLAGRLLERMGPSLMKLEEELDEAEERVIGESDESMRETILSIRRSAIMFRRYMAPQKDALLQLCQIDSTHFDPVNRQELSEAHNKITRYIEDLDAIRERAQVVNDELNGINAERLNRNLYILSIVSVIFLPLGFLTGMFGINLGGMPGADNDNAFYIFTLLLVGLTVAQIFLLKKFRLYFNSSAGKTEKQADRSE